MLILKIKQAKQDGKKPIRYGKARDDMVSQLKCSQTVVLCGLLSSPTNHYASQELPSLISRLRKESKLACDLSKCLSKDTLSFNCSHQKKGSNVHRNKKLSKHPKQKETGWIEEKITPVVRWCKTFCTIFVRCS